ncbi:hypothetical protein RRG08_057149 [Elysia crispata]|uniref:Uncharacterized protein n=1 Tax=Elysia crispata TaxID=231223 RepID=A0AAE1E3C5_9GAST|nr:hypothetical protein RRG08_057149 [Elysia crispata]
MPPVPSAAHDSIHNVILKDVFKSVSVGRLRDRTKITNTTTAADGGRLRDRTKITNTTTAADSGRLLDRTKITNTTTAADGGRLLDRTKITNTNHCCRRREMPVMPQLVERSSEDSGGLRWILR